MIGLGSDKKWPDVANCHDCAESSNDHVLIGVIYGMPKHKIDRIIRFIGVETYFTLAFCKSVGKNVKLGSIT